VKGENTLPVLAEYHSHIKPMKAWLRLSLVVMSVGGGFTGVVLATNTLINLPGQWGTLQISMACVLVAMSAFVTASGLLFVYDPRRTRLLQIALALQIPWISSPILLYKCFCGLAFDLFLNSEPLEGLGRISDHFGWTLDFGTTITLGPMGSRPWTIGVNFVAVFLFFMVGGAWRAMRQRQELDEEAESFWDQLPKPPASWR